MPQRWPGFTRFFSCADDSTLSPALSFTGTRVEAQTTKCWMWALSISEHVWAGKSPVSSTSNTAWSRFRGTEKKEKVYLVGKKMHRVNCNYSDCYLIFLVMHSSKSQLTDIECSDCSHIYETKWITQADTHTYCRSGLFVYKTLGTKC